MARSGERARACVCFYPCAGEVSTVRELPRRGSPVRARGFFFEWATHAPAMPPVTRSEGGPNGPLHRKASVPPVLSRVRKFSRLAVEVWDSG